MNTINLDIKAALREGWRTVKRNLKFLIVIMVINAAVNIIPDIPNAFIPPERQDALFGMLSIGIALIAAVVQLLFSLGLIKISLLLIDGQPAKVSDLWSQKHKLWRYCVASVLYGLIVVVGILFFIIPGIYLALKYQFYSYRVVETNEGVLEALRRSGSFTVGIKWQLLGFSLILMLINIVGAAALLVGLLITVPLSMLATAHVYRQLSGRSTVAPQSSPTIPPAAPAVA